MRKQTYLFSLMAAAMTMLSACSSDEQTQIWGGKMT